VATPLVSIVTPSFNQARFLPETLASVRGQEYQPLEHLVLDGGSTDGSVDLLRTAPGIQWASGPDRGQVDALNKGFARARGDVLAWLNSDDTFYPDTVSRAVEALDRTGADLVYGDLEMTDEAGRLFKICYGIPFDFRALLYGIDYLGQQTVFFRRALLERAGPLREEYDNAFDYELFVRFAAHGRFAYDPRVRARIRVHAAAKSVAHRATTLRENTRLRAEYWDRGGWPRLFQRRPWFAVPNYYYRLKRQFIARVLWAGRHVAGTRGGVP
jgi:glycosyltransferase involved in cell wall biosynthesis